MLLRINVVPVDILLAQKIHCALAHRRAMGGDFFDILHLIGRTAPNMGYLLEKTGIGTHEEVRDRLLARWRSLDTRALVLDVRPSLPDARDINGLELFADLVESWRPA